MSQVGIIIGREFNERVRKKSFIITTLLMPLLMVGLMFAPMLIMKYSRGDEEADRRHRRERAGRSEAAERRRAGLPDYGPLDRSGP